MNALIELSLSVAHQSTLQSSLCTFFCYLLWFHSTKLFWSNLSPSSWWESHAAISLSWVEWKWTKMIHGEEETKTNGSYGPLYGFFSNLVAYLSPLVSYFFIIYLFVFLLLHLCRCIWMPPTCVWVHPNWTTFCWYMSFHFYISLQTICYTWSHTWWIGGPHHKFNWYYLFSCFLNNIWVDVCTFIEFYIITMLEQVWHC